MTDNEQFQADNYRRTIKSYTKILTRRVNIITKRVSHEQRDVARKQGGGGRNNTEQIDLEMENVERKLNDMQEILDAVSQWITYCSNGNASYTVINYLSTLKTSITNIIRDVLNATCPGTDVAARTTTVAGKRGRADVERENVERDAVKRRKTRHDDNGAETSSSARARVRSSHADEKTNRSRSRNAETERTTSVAGKHGRVDVERENVERDAVKRRKTRHEDNGAVPSSSARARVRSSHADEKTNRSRSRNAETERTTSVAGNRGRDAAPRPKRPRTRRVDDERKRLFTVVVVNEMNPYYAKGVFATEDLFRFMARTIVHRLMDSRLCPDDHAIKSTIRQLMPEERITSEHEILTIIKPFY